jgi:hypothetical protein
MSRASLYRIPLWIAVSLALAITPQVSLAQHGGHAGGGFGGFHNGGGFGGLHSGGGLGFHNGSGAGGLRNGPGFSASRARGFPGYYHHIYGGFRSAYRNHYGVGFKFGFAPYWDGYGPWWPAPYYPYYYYPYQSFYYYGDRDDRCGPDCDTRGTDSCLPDYRHEDWCKDSEPATSEPEPESAPTEPTNIETSPNREYVSSNSEPQDYRSWLNAVAWRSASHANFGAAASTDGPGEIRPVVLNAIQALRAMPPAARLRQLKSDHYADFSPRERQLLEAASQPDLPSAQ